MSVRLEAIAFNHDPSSARSDALNIRRNAITPVIVPEWQRGVNFIPADSVAAYALGETSGNAITIQASFTRTDPTLASVEIRAINPLLLEFTNAWIQSLLVPFLPWPEQYNYYQYSYYFWDILMSSLGNVLGEVQPRLVTFNPNGGSGFVTLQLSNVQMWKGGVGVHSVLWRWQYRRSPAQPWTDFADSAHRIYTVLDVPADPWQQAPFHVANTQLPWIEVMDYACRWARGAKTVDQAASAVTENVYALGPELLEYGCVTLGSSQYAAPDGYFNCSAFLNRLRGGIGNGRYLNCTDCATIVSTFANCLGCNLSQARMGMILAFFAINPILAIGSRLWQTACGLPGFFYHEVAWKGACTANDEVFDACLQVDQGLDPTRPPFIPLLPANLRFGNTGEGTYRDRLATPQGRPFCVPQPSTRLRRPVF